MKKRLFNGLLAVLLMLTGVFVFSTCTTDDDDLPISDVGYITGKVTLLDGSPLSMVSVSLEEITVQSDIDGYYILDDIPVGEDKVITFHRVGFVTNYKKVDVLKDAYALAHAALSPVGIEAQVDADQETNIDFTGAQIKIPANSVVNASGSPVSGLFTIKATHFDPTLDNYIDVFPGDFKGESSAGNIGLLESFGFINVELSQDGNELNLAEGSVSDISIPVPAELQGIAPATIPLFFFDVETGIWKEEGSAELINGSYKGTVSHFSNWNADFIYEDQTCTIKGRVVDQNGDPVELARVIASGIDFSGSNVDFTGSDGRFSMEIKSDSRVVVYAELAIPGVGIIIGISPPKTEDTCPPDGMNDIGDLVIELPEHGNVDDVWWDVNSFNTSNLWIVGRNGKIQYSPDYGFSWQAQSSNTMSTLLGVHFINQNTGWTCGNNGAVLKTSDGGNTWESVQIPVAGNDLYEVLFVNDLLGWMVGTVGNIWRTEDGGVNWNKIQTNIQQDLHDVDFVNESSGWAVGNLGKILYSNDGGQNWIEQSSGTSVDLYGVAFTSDSEGWVVGLNGTILFTEDGGHTWTSQNSTTGEDLLTVNFNSNNGIGVAAGTNGKTVYTKNRGQSWESRDFGASGTCWDVELTLTTGVVVGDGFVQTFNLPDVYLVTEGWAEVSSPVQKFLTRVKFRTDQEGYILGQSGTILKTVDQGENWSPLNSGSDEYLQDISFTQHAIYVCGDYKTMLKSEDGGNSWYNFEPSIGIGDYLRIQFIDDQTGWVIESDSYQGIDRLLYTEVINDTLYWRVANGLPEISESDILDFQFLDKNTGWLVISDEYSSKSYIYKSENGGRDWTLIQEEDLTGFTNIFFLDDQNGWIGDLGGDLYKTVDGGQNWERIALWSVLILNSETKFIDENNGWALGFNFLGSTPYRSRDGGNNWYEQSTENGKIDDVLDIFMINENTGFAVGGWIDEAKIYKTTTGGD